jgi:uncharacterized protein (DUF1697 family)
VALLRAVNVGGHSVDKETLRDAFARAGGSNVRTVIQTGNVIFEATAAGAGDVVAGACRRLRAALGSEPVVMLRSAAEIGRLLRQGPFAGTTVPAIVKRYIVFLAGPPARRPRLPLLLPKEELDLVHVSSHDCWVVSRRKPNGWYGFPGEFVEDAMGVAGTARNWYVGAGFSRPGPPEGGPHDEVYGADSASETLVPPKPNEFESAWRSLIDVGSSTGG